MEGVHEDVPIVSRQVSPDDVQLIRSQFEGVACVFDCEGERLALARYHASKLDLVDERMLLPQNEAAYSCC